MSKKCENENRRISYLSFFWNAMHAGLSAVQSAIILFAVSRTKGMSEAGIITIGFTLATLAMILARYGIRNYQVTDVNEEYTFSDYYYVRIISTAGTLLAFVLFLSVMVVSGKYTVYKGCVLLELIILKIIDAFEGLYVGRLQQKGRLDIGARTATIRLACSTLVVFLLLWFIKSIPLCLLAGIIVSLAADLIILPKESRYASFRIERISKANVRKLLLIAFPLCLGTALYNYIGNAPKYLIDLFMSDEMQAISGYVMMPMFVITVLNTFIMQPVIKTMGDAWNQKDRFRLRRMILRHVLIVMAASFVVLILGIWIGLPLLSWLYNAELTKYHAEFCELMVGGSLYILSSYLIVLLTTMRNQKWIIVGCGISILTYILLGKRMVESGGFTGASVLYIISNAIMLLAFAGVAYSSWRKAFGGGMHSC